MSSHTRWFAAFAAILTASVSPCCAGEQTASSFSAEIRREVSLEFLVHLPTGYQSDGDERWPLMIFLHGAGERGSDINRVKVHGPPKLAQTQEDFPFVTISPQCPAGQWWDVGTLNALLDHVLDTYQVDDDRVYLTGLSMGGYGSWAWAASNPERFAAVAPICGGGERRPVLRAPSERRASMEGLPIWCFHGAKDTVVPLSESENMVEVWKQVGATVKFTVYPDAGHDSWTASYDNPDLFGWFLEQSR